MPNSITQRILKNLYSITHYVRDYPSDHPFRETIRYNSSLTTTKVFYSRIYYLSTIHKDAIITKKRKEKKRRTLRFTEDLYSRRNTLKDLNYT